ncbi:hypothetical protein [Rhodohalobacter mucosus]|uniref:Long-subunit fatty acid transport protein n=1 Tax=Rhodohalobacter mucosus TaxID=2079485 RepID=A0A316TQN7_9BACT|nr:hypothetical protein [Rhodohalobacter mucosus]PWN05559.1 hypothetical protein DDZ15_13215 [Rhodohalobacter mucosus]
MRLISAIFFFTVVIASFLLPENSSAQARDLASSGSFYSGFGFGLPVDVKSPYTDGMGVAGVSTFTNMTTSTANPAHWGLIGFTQGNLTLSMNGFRATDRNSSAENALLAFKNFQLVIPVLRNRLGVSASFTPLTRSNFEVFEEGNFDPLDVSSQTDDVNFISNIAGTGGINRFEIGMGLRLTENLSAGYGFSANLLAQQQESTVAFSDARYASILTNRDLSGYGYGHRFGLFMFKEDLFNEDDQLSVGASVNLPVTIDATRTISTFRTVENQRTLIELNEGSPDRNGTVTLPLEFNAGLTYNLSRFVNVTAEMLMQEWDEARYSYSAQQEAYYKNRVKTGLGVQYHPYRDEQADGLLSGLKYSFGTSYDTGHLSINGNDIETILFNAGIGVISTRSSSSIDLNFHYGIRGTQSSDLVKENIWGFTLSLNLAEFMFVRPKFQ